MFYPQHFPDFVENGRFFIRVPREYPVLILLYFQQNEVKPAEDKSWTWPDIFFTTSVLKLRLF